MQLILLLIILAVCISICYYVVNKMAYFERLKVPYWRPIPVLGNMASALFGRLALAEVTRTAYNHFTNAKYVGFYDFLTPVYIIRDPELILSIGIKNFDYFTDHSNFINENIDLIAGKNLFGLKGNHWREVRRILSPSFTANKMKMMFGLIRECAENFSDFLANEAMDGKEYEMKHMLTRYTNDVITTCAYGIKLDSNKDPNNEFLYIGRNNITFGKKMYLKFVMNKHFPLLSKFLGIRMFSDKMENFFKGVVKDTVKLRKETGIVRPDMIQLMLESIGNDDELINIDEMTSQAFIFFLGGFETTSKALSFLMHEVGVNSDVQRRLQAEIDNVIRETNGKPTFEDINGMKYLAAVFEETLRMYPLVAFLDRVCVKDFEIPPATPDSQPITLKPGDIVWIPNYAVHRDPQYFPDPHKFDPNRFLDGKMNRSLYMPFGIGPRQCIGYRFALIVVKILLFTLLSHCDLEPCKKTKIPLVLGTQTFLMMAEGGFWMKISKRKSTAFA